MLLLSLIGVLLLAPASPPQLPELAVAQQAVRQNPSSAAAWKTLAMVLAASRKTEESIGPFTKACDLGPEDAEACYYLGRSLNALGRYEKARPRYEQALRMEQSSRIHRATALNMLALGDTRETERHFIEAIHRYRESLTEEDPKVDYGAFLVRQGRSTEALGPLEKAVNASPKSVRANMELGKALLHLGKLKPAVLHLEKAVALDPKAWSARLLLGKAYLQSGRTADGEREMQLGQQGWAKQNESPANVK